jgi:hypothetical protein
MHGHCEVSPFTALSHLVPGALSSPSKDTLPSCRAWRRWCLLIGTYCVPRHLLCVQLNTPVFLVEHSADCLLCAG